MNHLQQQSKLQRKKQCKKRIFLPWLINSRLMEAKNIRCHLHSRGKVRSNISGHPKSCRSLLIPCPTSVSLCVCLHFWPDVSSNWMFFSKQCSSVMLIIYVSLTSFMQHPPCFIFEEIRGFILPPSFVCSTSFPPQRGCLDIILCCCSSSAANTVILRHMPLKTLLAKDRLICENH